MKHYVQTLSGTNTLAVYLSVGFLVIASLTKNNIDFLPSSIWEEVTSALSKSGDVDDDIQQSTQRFGMSSPQKMSLTGLALMHKP
jgi:hypothetical protein